MMAAAETLYGDIDHCVDNPPPLVICEHDTMEKTPDIEGLRNWSDDQNQRIETLKVTVPRMKFVNRTKPGGENILLCFKNTPKTTTLSQQQIVPVISKATNNKPMNVEILKKGNWNEINNFKPLLTLANPTSSTRILEDSLPTFSMEYEDIIREVIRTEPEQMPQEKKREESLKISRELKDLHQSTLESKVLSDYVNESIESRARKVKKLKEPLNDTEESIGISKSRRSLTPADSTISDHMDSPDSSLRIMRSNNPEFSQRHDEFLSRFVNDTLSDNAEDENDKISVNSNVPFENRIMHPPPRVRTKNH